MSHRPKFVPTGYQVARKLGSGQTSHVYLTQHGRLGQVALKLPRDELHTQPVLRRMFENEVQITLGLDDEYVVKALDGFPTGEQAFLALELCPGGTLDQLLLGKGRLELNIASKLVLEVAQGLEHSHSRQVLHRDVKPANVFLTAEGNAKLGDFGTGIFLTDGKRLEEQVGTAFYMAPEVFEGKPATVQSDVYSLGVLAYEVIAGQRPFVGSTYEELMLQHLTSLPRNLQNVRQDMSKELNNVVARAMSRDPSKRFGTVREFMQTYSAVSGVPLNKTQDATLTTGRGSRPRTQERSVTKTAARQPESQPSKGLFGWFKRGKK